MDWINYIPGFVVILVPLGVILFAIKDEMDAREKLDRDRDNELKQVHLRQLAREIEEMERG